MSKIFEKILCPVDFDRNFGAAIELAGELAEPYRSTVYFLHVISLRSMGPIALEPGPVFTEGVAERELEKRMQKRLPSNVRHRIIVQTGDPASTIIAAAEKLKVDLIAMPTHGHTGITRMIMGSVAERVVREAKHPVLTVRPKRAGL